MVINEILCVKDVDKILGILSNNLGAFFVGWNDTFFVRVCKVNLKFVLSCTKYEIIWRNPVFSQQRFKVQNLNSKYEGRGFLLRKDS